MLVQIVITSFLTSLVSSRICDGASSVGAGTRISGGMGSERNSRPFQEIAVISAAMDMNSGFRHYKDVALYLRAGTGALGFCGGALLHPRWVLTAAHCCFHDGQKVDRVQAIFGAHSLYDRYENGRRIVEVAELAVHPDWQPESFAHDLALLQLANTLQLTDTIEVVRLPYLSMELNSFAGLGATASGWGIAAPGVTFVSPTLREKLMTVMTDDVCNRSYSDLLPENTVCGFSLEAGTCKGDNGGPLTIFSSDTEETILIGVSSFVNQSGCNEDVPSVFTRVQRYLRWISDVTGIELE